MVICQTESPLNCPRGLWMAPYFELLTNWVLANGNSCHICLWANETNTPFSFEVNASQMIHWPINGHEVWGKIG